MNYSKILKEKENEIIAIMFEDGVSYADILNIRVVAIAETYKEFKKNKPKVKK